MSFVALYFWYFQEFMVNLIKLILYWSATSVHQVCLATILRMFGNDGRCSAIVMLYLIEFLYKCVLGIEQWTPHSIY
jgi:hypothetical protein